MTDERPEIKNFHRYTATVKLRRGDRWQVKPECESLDGRRMRFQAALPIEDDDRYPGEWAMLPDPLDVGFPTGWVASGDLVDWEER